MVEQTLSVLAPGQRFDLEGLTVDTVAGGQQSPAPSTSSSADVAPVLRGPARSPSNDRRHQAPTWRSSSRGSDQRFTGQDDRLQADRDQPRKRPGPKNVKVVASRSPQQGGKLLCQKPKLGRSSTWRPVRSSGRSPNSSRSAAGRALASPTGPSTPGLYTGDRRGDRSGELRASRDPDGPRSPGSPCSTSRSRRPIGSSMWARPTIYDITIKNSGTKEANRLQLKGQADRQAESPEALQCREGGLRLQRRHRRVRLPRASSVWAWASRSTLEPGSASHRERPGRLSRLPRPRRHGLDRRQGRGRDLHHRHREPVERRRGQTLSKSGNETAKAPRTPREEERRRGGKARRARPTPHSTPH